MFLRLLIILSCLIVMGPFTAQAQHGVDPEKAKLIKELLELTNSKKNAVAAFNALLDQNEKSMPEIVWQSVSGAAEFATLTPRERIELRKIVDRSSVRVSRQMREMFLQRVDFGQMVDEIYYPLFDKYFSSDELKSMNAFYASAVGKKSIEVFPAIFGEAVSKSSALVTPQVTAIMQEVMRGETAELKKEMDKLKGARKPRQVELRKGRP